MPRRRGQKGGAKRRSQRVDNRPRRRSRHLEGVTDIDVNNHDFLGRFVTDLGKIVPARLTGATARQQRRIKMGIRRARNMGLIP
jgi:small subunit ribosomal protein S18